MRSAPLFIVATVVDSGESGLLLAPGIPDDQIASICPGTKIELRLPSGAVLASRVHSVVTLSPRVLGSGFPITVPLGITREQVPLGTEVWLAANGA
jgi:hypothetical protein